MLYISMKLDKDDFFYLINRVSKIKSMDRISNKDWQIYEYKKYVFWFSKILDYEWPIIIKNIFRVDS